MGDIQPNEQNPIDFKRLFESLPGLYLILSPDFEIIAVSNAYLDATMTERDAILGKNLFDVFPDNPNDPNATGEQNLKASLTRVLTKKLPDKMQEQKYDIRRPISEGGQFEVRYWSPMNMPLLGEDLSVIYIIHNVTDVTELHESTTERERAVEQLRISKLNAEDLAEKAMVANRAKSAFLATMSHEIRTPLNGVIGMTDLLLDMDQTDEQREYIETIRYSSDILLNIINDILDFSKIESGNFQLDITDFDLRNLVENTLEMVALRAHQKGLAVGAFIKKDVPSWITGDNLRLGQILKNLLDNAVKFTENGEVSLTISRLTSAEQHLSVADNLVTLQFEVIDTGIGISKDVAAQLFQPFVQGDASVTRKYGGTGLGLVICKRLVELMGGSIQIVNDLPSGSHFIFTINVHEAPIKTESDTYTDLYVDDFSQQRILIVDDNNINQRILSAQLNSWGMYCAIASNGEDAIAMLRSAHLDNKPFTIALIDYAMPTMDGIELAKKLKEDPDLSLIHIMMLTSVGLPVSSAELSEIGILHCLTKPVRQSKLYNTLISFFSNKTKAPMPNSRLKNNTSTLQLQERSSKEILVVEDYFMNQKVILQILKRLGYHADIANNGKESLVAYQSKDYDLILMDCQMPEMDGYAATQEIRKIESDNARVHVPIIAMTAHALKEDKEKCLRAGMDDYISKPIRMKDVEEILNRWISQGKTMNPPSAQVLDIPFIKDLFDNNSEDINQFLNSFVQETQVLLDNIDLEINAKNPDKVRALVHSLKGSCGNCGAHELCALAKALEDILPLSDWQKMHDLMQKIRVALRSIPTHIEK